MTDAHDPALAALYAQVYAAPDDDAPRLALADALTRAGDPRGEFITLQYRVREGVATREEVVRAKALLKSSARAWAGALGPLLAERSYAFDRGFLCDYQPKAPKAEQLRDLATSDAWGTVTSLSLASWASPRKLPAYAESVEVAGEVLTSERAPALRRVSVHAAAVLTKIARATRPLPYEALECSGWFHLYCHGFALSGDDLALLGATRALPRLRRLALSTHGHGAQHDRGPTRFEALLRGEAFGALEHFGLTDVGDALPAWLDALSAMPAPSKTFEVVFGAGSWADREGVTLCFLRDASGRFSRLAVTVHEGAREHQHWVFHRVSRVLAPLDRAMRASAALTLMPGKAYSSDGAAARQAMIALVTPA